MKTKALTLSYFTNIDERYINEVYSRDEAAQYVQNTYLPHPLYTDFYYNPEKDELFHVTLNISNGLSNVYKIEGTMMNGYRVILFYINDKKVCRYYKKFVKECVIGRPIIKEDK